MPQTGHFSFGPGLGSAAGTWPEAFACAGAAAGAVAAAGAGVEPARSAAPAGRAAMKTAAVRASRNRVDLRSVGFAIL